MSEFLFDMNRYHALARQTAAEGCVLLKNDRQALPLRKGERVSVFGRIAWSYYKSGTGSGGLVNTHYVTGILDALKASPEIRLNEELMAVYEAWLKENPFNHGVGWGGEPWCQEEMPLTQEIVAAAREKSDCALVVIGRTAGEDRDASATEGSFLLTEKERDMLAKVCAAFPRTAVLLNVGNIIDMAWVKEFDPAAVMYVWQAGQEGGNGTADVLLGRVSPCGKLTDTIADSIDSYPSTEGFGDPDRTVYREDIYTGYRYFETFCPEKVLYPFGFGLSYTEFTMAVTAAEKRDDSISLTVSVANTGSVPGREVVQLYASKPQGKLGQPAKVLIGYEKTALIAPGKSEEVSFAVPLSVLASYDDSGLSGHKSCWVLEAGRYSTLAGTSVRNTMPALEFSLGGTLVVEALEEACSPTLAYERMRPVEEGGRLVPGWEPVPTRSYDLKARIDGRKLPASEQKDMGLTFTDVANGTASLRDFVNQFTDEELACLVRGEGMSSPKATPGTAGAIGGVSTWAARYGIPVGCVSDGPSGIRMDCGTKATSLPNGTCLGCTWDDDLVRELYTYVGYELRKFHIDSLLGPGINIHRNPLCGRNFEYISEDPFLSGHMGTAQVKGMGVAGVTGTVKHFAANNQEFHRHVNDSVVSERCLREIYLKAFEICVKEGDAYSIMTSYNGINGIWCAGNYDLVAVILRQQMGYNGLVMTDWWARMNEEGRTPDYRNTQYMVRSQNDLFMVTGDTEANSAGDHSMEGLAEGTAKRGDFLLAAENILRFLLRSPVALRALGIAHPSDFIIVEDKNHEAVYPDCESLQKVLPGFEAAPGMEKYYKTDRPGECRLTFSMVSNSEAALSQGSMSVFCDEGLLKTFTWTGGGTQQCSLTLHLPEGGTHYVKLYFPVGGVTVTKVEVN